ncbi:MAG: hypothetical protein R3308_03965, partial [Thiohalobacterales bacterium]|nr:hypothetical protein [Thiohalobacterales bacterium]
MSPDSHPYSPFDLARESDYRHWREDKLADYPDTAEHLLIRVGDPGDLDEQEQAAILASCRKTNMAIYRGAAATDKHGVRALGRRFGLERLDMNLRADEDSITSLRVVPAGAETHYIPYTSHRLNWHTDGYY